MANANLRFACRQTDERRQKTFEFRLAFPSGILSLCRQNLNQRKQESAGSRETESDKTKNLKQIELRI